MPSPSSRDQFEAPRAERTAYSIAFAGFAAVRSHEAAATFGFDIKEAEREARQIQQPSEPAQVDDAMAFLRARTARRRESLGAAIGPLATAAPDAQGEQQIGYDKSAWLAMKSVAEAEMIGLIGEEDEYRAGPDGARRRGERLWNLITTGMPFGIADPCDGTNQVAGMGQRSGWASCVMVHQPPTSRTDSVLLTPAVLLGDGRAFVGGEGGIWLSESSSPDRPSPAYLLDPMRSMTTFARHHYVIPASKAKTIAAAHAIIDQDAKIQWIAPLAGNPGILAAMLCAGAVAAMQPEAWAWDHMAALMLAYGGLQVIDNRTDAPKNAAELSAILLEDLIAGRQTRALYMARDLDLARRLRDAAAAALLSTLT